MRFHSALVILAACFVLMPPGLRGQAQAQAQPQAAQQAAPSAHLQAELLKPVDSAKAKAGDEVTARTVMPLALGDKKFPVGSTVIGHVTEIGPGQLGLTFDQIAVKKNPPVPLALSLRAVMMPHGAPASTGEEISPSANSGPGGGLLRSPTMAAQDSSVSIFDGNHPVTATNGGVVGMPGVRLLVSADSKMGCVFQSEKGADLKLEKGLQLMFVVTAQ